MHPTPPYEHSHAPYVGARVIAGVRHASLLIATFGYLVHLSVKVAGGDWKYERINRAG